MKKLIFILTASLAAFGSMACDAGKGVTAPVIAYVAPTSETDVPFNYTDCTAPATATFTISTKAKVKYFTVRVRDLTTGIEYTPDPYAAYSTTQVLTAPAAGHSLVVVLLNGTRGTKLTVSITVQ